MSSISSPSTRPTSLSTTLARLLMLGASVAGLTAAATPATTPAAVGSAQASAVTLDPALKPYVQVAGVSGSLTSIGSDTLNNLMTFWAEDFNKYYPNVKIGIEAKGTSTAPPALIQGTAQLGPMSRPMTSKEQDLFKAKFGYPATEIKVAIDGLAVFVHKDNPITSLTLAQVDSIFSSTFKRGGKDITLWSQLGLTGWDGKAISLYGRNSASGTYGFFKEFSLNKGDYKATVKEQPGTSSVVTGVAGDVNGIGYGGIGYLTSGVKALPLAEKTGGTPIEPTQTSCMNGTYPLARFLYVYINKAPGKPLEPLVAEFIKFIGSLDGQKIVVKDGYFPLSVTFVSENEAAIAK